MQVQEWPEWLDDVQIDLTFDDKRELLRAVRVVRRFFPTLDERMSSTRHMTATGPVPA